MGIQFKKATKSQSKLRLALIGPSGSGKTYSALAIATNLGKRVAVIDTENGSASLYADEFSFDVLELSSFSPYTYVEAIKAAESAGYDAIVIDSLSHAWVGKDGALDMKEQAVTRQKTKNDYTAWRDVTPAHNALVDGIIRSDAHIIATMRAKTEYVQEKDERGKTTIRKVGLAPIQRDGLDYEFTLVGDMDLDHTLAITKSRCKALADKVIRLPGRGVAETLLSWLNDGAPAEEKPAAQPRSTSANDEAQTPAEPQADARVAKLLELYAKASEMVHVDAVRDMVMTQNGERAFSRDDRTKLAAARAEAQDRIRAAAA
jgi:hypothetical protein